MHTITWLAPAFSNAALRTLIHFFPSAGNVAAPYPIHCRFRLFGDGGSTRPVTIEGPRLSNPDGVWLHQVFPELEGSGQSLVGVEISLSSNQPRINLQSSACFIEYSSLGYSCRFRPVQMLPGQEQAPGKKLSSGIAIKDAFSVPSVLLVNSQAQPVRSQLLARFQKAELCQKESLAELGYMPPLSVQEVSLPEKFFEQSDPAQLSWGLVRGCSVDWIEFENTACYILHRSALTRVPVSVRAL